MAEVTVGENSFAVDKVKAYREAQRIRNPLEADWREVSRLGLPRHYSGWTIQNGPQTAAGTGAARQSRIATYDSTLMRALPMYAAVLERILTPGTQIYHTLQAQDDRAKQSRAVTLGLEKLNAALFKYRYEFAAGFSNAQAETYVSGGAYGNAGKLITWREPNRQMKRRGGLLYRNIPFRNLFWDIDDDEQIYNRFRRIDWTAQQAVLALGDKCPKPIAEDAKKTSGADANKTYEFFHCICPSQDYDESALDYRRHPFGSYYIYVAVPTVVQEASGYSSCPLVISRSATEGGMPYGYGEAQTVLSTVGLLNAQKKTWIRSGQLALNPPLLTRDDGVMNGTVDQTPGAANPGGVDAQGRKMVQAMDVGNVTMAEKLIAMEQDDVKAVLFGKIFEVLKDQPQMTATQVLDIAAREAGQLAPTMGRYQAEDLGPTVEREISLLAEHGQLAKLELPSELSDLEYAPIYTSYLAKSQHSESVSGFMRITEMAMNVAKQTGDNRPVRRLNFDLALPEIAAQQGVPSRWVKSDEEMAASDAEAAQRQKTEDMISVAPAAASVGKAMMDKNGGQTTQLPS